MNWRPWRRRPSRSRTSANLPPWVLQAALREVYGNPDDVRAQALDAKYGKSIMDAVRYTDYDKPFPAAVGFRVDRPDAFETALADATEPRLLIDDFDEFASKPGVKTITFEEYGTPLLRREQPAVLPEVARKIAVNMGNSMDAALESVGKPSDTPEVTHLRTLLAWSQGRANELVNERHALNRQIAVLHKKLRKIQKAAK